MDEGNQEAADNPAADGFPSPRTREKVRRAYSIKKVNRIQNKKKKKNVPLVTRCSQ